METGKVSDKQPEREREGERENSVERVGDVMDVEV